MVNPKEECKAVVLRSGKVLEDKSKEKVDAQDEDKTVEESPVSSTPKPTTKEPISTPSSSSVLDK
ncbi:hypothetical protein PIB30_116016, partial [Stylosanthes scabra]|nr:hypothetical protein [Stylosanthes scabra]